MQSGTHFQSQLPMQVCNVSLIQLSRHSGQLPRNSFGFFSSLFVSCDLGRLPRLVGGAAQLQTAVRQTR